MNKLKNLFYALAAVVAIGLTVQLAWAGVPWGTVFVTSPSATNATCTSFASANVCLLNLTGNLSGTLTLSGTPSPNGFSLIFMQDGTGSRTFTAPANLVASAALGTLPAIPSAANAYTVWSGHMSGSNYVVDSTYDNMPMGGVFSTTFTSNGSAVAPATAQAQPTIVAPGAALGNPCIANLQGAKPATWVATTLDCAVSTTNAVIVTENNPSAATLTPTAVSVNVKLLPSVTSGQ